MSTIADSPRVSEDEPLAADSPAPALIYLLAGIGLAISLLGLLFAHGEFSIGTVALALLASLPWLLFARLAMARPGVEAVVCGVLLLTVGTWGSIVSMDGAGDGAFVRLPLSLLAVELAVFGAGALLRIAVPPRRAP